MKSVSNEFKQAAIAPVKQSNVLIVVLSSGTTYSGSDYIQSVSLESTGELFGSTATQATIKLLGDNYNLLNEGINISFQLFFDDGNEQINYGTFYVTEQTVAKNKETTEIKAINKMLQFQNLQYSELQGYPKTVSEFAESIAEVGGCSLSSMTQLPNYDYSITQDLYSKISGISYRDIISEIAGATASMGYIDNVENILIFKPYQGNVQQQLDYQYLKKYEKGENYGPVNTLVLSRLPQEDNIYVQDTEMVERDGNIEVKLANNEILDDDRETLISPLFNEIKGIEWTGFEIETVGLGWLECGDRISITDDNNDTIEGIITYIKLTFDGGIKEMIKGVPPIKKETNYSMAGGIVKTIYNTEIKVDKQNQTIESIVEEQRNFENETINNFTRIRQEISSITTNIQVAGGNNRLRNSAFFASDDNGDFINWTYTTLPTVFASGEAEVMGSLSGQVINVYGNQISQTITVKADDSSIPESDKTYYSFSCKAKKSTAGTASIIISDGTSDGEHRIDFPNGTGANWDELAIDKILPSTSELTITLIGSADSLFQVTDLMINVGDFHQQWEQASGEANNTAFALTTEGATVKNGNLASVWTKMTPDSFDVFQNRTRVSALNEEFLLSRKAKISEEIDIGPIKIVARPDGIAFVKNS